MTTRPLLYAVLALAILIGIGAALLVAAAPPPPHATAGELVIDLPPAAWGLLLISPLLVGFGAIFIRRLTGPAGELSTQSRFMIVAVFALLLLFTVLLAARGGGGGGLFGISTGSHPTNTTQTSSQNNTTTPPAGGSNGTVAGTTFLRIPGWLPVAVAAGIAAVVAVLALPGVVRRIADRSPGAPAPRKARAAVRQALAGAGAAIDRGDDLRTTVVLLYVRLLETIEPRAGDVSCLTAEEIRCITLAHLGVTPASSEALTRVFEEARYSTHPIGPEAAGRFRQAIRQVELDLVRGIAS